MTHRVSSTLLASVLVLGGAAALGACGRSDHARDPVAAADDPGDPDRDSANLRADGMREWWTESKTAWGRFGNGWSVDYRKYLLGVARDERTKWAALMPGSRRPLVITASQWKSLGPTTSSQPGVDSGRITAIVPDSANGKLYIATAGGGVWRRQNNTWAPLSETLGTLSCGALAMDPSNHDHLYLGLGDSFDGTGVGLLTSTDGGTNWSDPIFLGTSMKIPQIIVDPAQNATVLVATDAGLYRSTNSGTSFAPVAIPTTLSPGPTVWSIASTGGHGFVASLGSIPVDSEVTDHGEIWYSSDDGATWKLATGLPAAANVGRMTVASAPSNPLVVYAMAGANNANSSTDLVDIYKSSDGGKTFSALGVTNKSYGGGRMSGLLNAQGWYNQVVLVDPTNPQVAYFGGALTLVKTSDGGSTFSALTSWTGTGRPYVHADFHTGVIDGTNIYVGTDGGLFQSTNAGAAWSDSLNSGLVTHLLYSVGSSPAAKDEVIGGMQDNGTRLRSGATSTFDEVIGGDGFGAAINRTNGQRMLGSLYYDGIQSSSDGGNNWGDATSGIAEANDSSNAPFITRIVTWEGGASTGNEVYTFSNTKVYKSTNFGGSWTALPTPAISASGVIIRNIGIAPTNPNLVGVVASGGGVFLSKDGGSTWTQLANGKLGDPGSLPNSDRSMSWISFDPTNPATMYVASVAPEASVNHLWKSTDSGAHWASIDGHGLPVGVPINVIKPDPVPVSGQPGMVLYAGTHMGVYRSTDGGQTWSRFGSGMPLVSVTDLYVSPDESLVRAATYGRGFWEITTPTNDFALTANPATVSVQQGASGTTQIAATLTAGAAQNVALSVTGLPSGATASFTPTTISTGGTSTLKLTAGAATKGGSYTLTVTGTGTGVTHTVTVIFDVGAANDFSITADPASVTVAEGASATTMIDTTITAGVAQDVALSATGAPAGVTVSFSPSTLTTGGSAVMTVAADATAAPGDYVIAVTADGPSVSHSTNVGLTVSPTGDFTIAVAPTTVAATIGFSASYATVSTTVASGQPVPITLTVDGAPTGVTASLDSTMIDSGGTATLSVIADSTAQPGSATVTITGTSGGIVHTATLTVTIAEGTGPGETGNSGGCCSAGSASFAPTSGNLAIALVVVAGFARRRRRGRRG